MTCQQAPMLLLFLMLQIVIVVTVSKSNNNLHNGVASSNQCASVSAFGSPNQSDLEPILDGGGGTATLWPNTAMFMSSYFMYRVDVDSSGALVVQQVDIGPYLALTGAVGVYPGLPMIMHVIPFTSISSTVKMHFVSIKNGQFYEPKPPHPLDSVVDQTFFPRVSTALTGDQGTLDIFFATANRVVRVCPYLGQTIGQAVLDFSTLDNPLNVDHAYSIQADEKVRRLFIARHRELDPPDAAADIVVVQIPANSCRLILDQRVFVQPQPASLSVLGAMSKIGAYLYWPMAPDRKSGPDGRLYRWDLLSTQVGVGNISLGLSVGDRIAPVGFAKLFHASLFYGVVASLAPGQVGILATTIDAGDAYYNPHKFEIMCQTLLGMSEPLSYAALGGGSRILFSGRDSNFTLVDVPMPTLTSNVQKRAGFESNTTAAAPAQCPSYSFGLPPTCSACSPPSAVCGLTEHCSNGCCFVNGGRVLCCTQSPPGTTTAGFSCA
jgi:hypothetical protein